MKIINTSIVLFIIGCIIKTVLPIIIVYSLIAGFFNWFLFAWSYLNKKWALFSISVVIYAYIFYKLLEYRQGV